MITIITGPMFSGKTANLVAYARVAEANHKRVVAMRPAADTRGAPGELRARDGSKWPAVTYGDPGHIDQLVPDGYELAVIDEANLAVHDAGNPERESRRLVEALLRLERRGVDTVVACLASDHMGRPFAPSPWLLAIAMLIHVLRARCARCGAYAQWTARRRETPEDALVAVGDSDIYESLCAEHFASLGGGRG